MATSVCGKSWRNFRQSMYFNKECDIIINWQLVRNEYENDCDNVLAGKLWNILNKDKNVDNRISHEH
jgi:hypothetical protein